MELEDTDDLPQEFKGGTLEFNSDEVKKSTSETKINTNVEVANSNNNQNNNNQNLWENSLISPFLSIPQRITESIWSKKSTESNNSSSALKAVAEIPTVSGKATDFFTFRQGIIEQAIIECIEQFLDLETEGPTCVSFLLTEISLWDTDKERLILLTPRVLVIVKYDFIAMRRLEYKKILLECVDTIVIGNLVYPTASIVPHLHGFADGVSSVVQNCLFDTWSKNKPKKEFPNYFPSRNRNTRGVRLMWNNGKPLNFGNKWNPLNNDVPLSTFTAHPLFSHNDSVDEAQRNLYNIEEFIQNICSNIVDLKVKENSCVIQHNDITLDNYIGIGSLIHNRNALGFFKVRGKFSF